MRALPWTALLPESPRHLIYKDRMTDARAAIAQMNETTPDSALVDDIVAELLDGIREENEGGKATWAECFSPAVRMRTINGMMSKSPLGLKDFQVTKHRSSFTPVQVRSSFAVSQL